MHLLSSDRRISRRRLLRGAGVALGLPFLEAMLPPFTRRLFAATPVEAKPQRLFAICNNLGVLPNHFFPSQAGRDYELSPYLEELSSHRNDFTVLSGVHHPGVDGAHSSDVSFLTAATHPGGGGFRNTISLDQYVAGEIGHHTRFPSLTLGVNAAAGRRSLSWTPSGVLIPCEDSAASVYKQLFLQGSEKEIENQIEKLKLGESIMDTVAEQSRALNRRLGASDRDRMDQYTTAVRETERRMKKAREWERLPKPVPSAECPIDPGGPAAYMEKTRLMYEMARLAFETDSTRSITLLLDSNNSPTITVSEIPISDGYHNLSHHGKDEKKLAQLEAIDRNHMRLISQLISAFKDSKDGDASLLENSLILYGSNLGDANKHTTDNMPMLVAGGRLKHGQHLAFDRDKNYPLPNLFVSMLQSMGIEADTFASSTGTMRGLDLKAIS
ncbi:hypothetical protein Pan14r_53200 [Crateriforma conspicua]|uniref:DUF1552 domain-containing protein n=1 Tax=Crateriforma conspicua TaxID=2527996 RepID=A0A5C5XSD0_9PLAN|nr:hypothetical protein Pan14r_53200 [Crateriforma conspicua]